MLKPVFISFFTLLFFAANAQESDTSYIKDEEVISAPVSNDTLYIDTTLYFERPAIPADSIAYWKNKKEFAYIKDMDSLLLAAKKKQKKAAPQEEEDNSSNWLERLLSSQGIKTFFWFLAVFFVLFILFKLFLSEGAFRRRTKTLKTETPEVTDEVISNETDLQSLIRQALQAGNYRLAVRYHYLNTLYKLADKKLVELATDKTNYQYVREVSNQKYQNDFASLTLNYEYVWYGEFEIEEGIYRRIENGFSQFNSKL